MAILKLTPGREYAVAGTVSAVRLEPSKNPKFKDQYAITLASGDLLYLDKDAVERQAARLSKLPNELEGETLTFWKKPLDTDPSRGYLNIDLGAAPGSSVNRVAAAARNDDYVGRDLRNAGVPLPSTSYDAIKDKYVECLGDTHSILSDASALTGVPFTPAEYTSVAATLFIERNKKGV